MRKALVLVLCVGCSSSTTGDAPDASPDDAIGAVSDTSSPSFDTADPTDAAAIDTGATGPVSDAAEGSFSDVTFVGTATERSAWICLHMFVSSDVTSSTPFSSLGPIGATGDGADANPLTFGRAVRVTGSSETDAAFAALTVVVSAQTTKPASCKASWPAVAPSTNDWVLVPPATIPHGYDAAVTLGDKLRVYKVEAKVVAGAYVAQLINEGEGAASFAIQRRDEGGAAIGAPVPLAEGKIASHAIGAATPLALPTTGAFAASDLVVDATPLSLFGPSLTRLAWSKDDGAGSLVVFAGTTSAPAIVLVPWR